MKTGLSSAVVLLALAGPLAAQQNPEETLKAMQPAEDLEVRLFAHEPQLYNPTAIDVDARGRVWVAEGVNYRGAAGPQQNRRPFFPNPKRKTGDRIVVLEDKDGDGRADSSRVFYEGLDIQAPLGIAVIGNKVWLAQAPDLFTLEIKPDGTAGKKETVLTGFGGLNHDHAVHSVYLGPEGKLYGCFGNSGANVAFPDGRKVVTNGNPYRGGCAWRSNLDLSGVEVLGHNFRNNYECATDSFGTTFQSDNDDDGNQMVRFTYVMEGGDFGYAGYPKGTHWRMEYPGVVPILMRTGQGSPTGLCHYEGKLLPKRFHGQPIHVDAGPGVVWSFIMKPDGAGYRVENAAVDADGRQTIDTLYEIRRPPVLLQCKDRWFRPSDVCVAPDGSLFVADWYDPGVGGHGMGDPGRGRIYRLIPKGHDGAYRVTRPDVSKPEGLVGALASPCLSTRALAILEIKRRGAAAIPILKPLTTASDRILRARALQMIGSLGDEGRSIVRAVLKDPDPDFRILAIRNLRLFGADMSGVVREVEKDPSAAVRREALLVLRDVPPAKAKDLAVSLALAYDGHDRFYLEAVNIAFGKRKDEFVPALLEKLKGKWDRRVAGLLWLFQRPEAMPMALSVLKDASRSDDEKAAAVRVLEGVKDPKAGKAILDALGGKVSGALAREALEALGRKIPVNWRTLIEDPALAAAVERYASDPAAGQAANRLGGIMGTRALVRWMISPTFPNAGESGFDTIYPPERTNSPHRLPGWKPVSIGGDGQVDLRDQCEPKDAVVVYAATVLYAKEPIKTRLLLGSDDGVKVWMNGALVHSNHQHRASVPRQDTVSVSLRAGFNELLLKVDQGNGGFGFIVEIEDFARKISEFTGRDVALESAPASERLNPKALPPLKELLAVRGDARRGREIFFRSKAACAKCHRVNGEGGEISGIGPDLSAIGLKGGAETHLRSIVRPSDAVAHEFVQWIVKPRGKDPVSGILVRDDGNVLVLKDNNGKEFSVPASEIEAKKASKVSPMPEGLVAELTKQSLADLVAYLAGLKPAGQEALPPLEAGFRRLFNGKDFTGIKFTFGNKNHDASKTFSVKDGAIVCSGHPAGYWYTEKNYKDFTLKFDFRYDRPGGNVDENRWGGNSGYLLFLEPPHKVWPKCVEVQGMNRDVLMLIGLGVPAKQTFHDPEARKRVRKPLGQWNSVEIVSKGGVITSSLNGTRISVIEAPQAKAGPIAFQSEGAGISWRNVRIKTD